MVGKFGRSTRLHGAVLLWLNWGRIGMPQADCLSWNTAPSEAASTDFCISQNGKMGEVQNLAKANTAAAPVAASS